MIEELLAPEVVGVDVRGDWLDIPLFPVEEAALVRCVDKRRREFTTARGCARAALARLGRPPAPVVPGAQGEPGWPPGIAGSITHCTDYRAAAVALVADVAALGIDAEPDEPLPDEIVDYVASASERQHLAELARSAPPTCWDRLLFSAKESVYKAWFPLTRRWLGFEDATVTVDATGGSFEAQLHVPGPVVGGGELRVIRGRWLARDGLVVTAVAVPARPPLPHDH